MSTFTHSFPDTLVSSSLLHKHAFLVHTPVRQLHGLQHPAHWPLPAFLSLIFNHFSDSWHSSPAGLWSVLGHGMFFSTPRLFPMPRSQEPFPWLFLCIILSNAYFSWKWLLLRESFSDHPPTTWGGFNSQVTLCFFTAYPTFVIIF